MHNGVRFAVNFYIGDLLAEIETDKATMGFETPEEGYLAKILIQAGQKDVAIGKLVCIIVENEADVAAFKDFKDTGMHINGHNRFHLILTKMSDKTKRDELRKILLISGAAPSKPAAAAPASAAAAPPTPSPPPIAAAPAAARPMTAVEQHFGDRVYASPMAKRLAEAQALRLEGMCSPYKFDAKSADIDVASAFCRQRKRCVWIDYKQRSWFIVRRRWRFGPSRTHPNRCRIHRYSRVEYPRHHRQALAGIEGYDSALLLDGRCQCG